MQIAKAIFAPKEFTGWHMFGVLFLFFGTIITVNMVLAFSANSTWTGLMVKNTYVESQHFNERTDAFKKQAAMGWQYALGYDGKQFSVKLDDAASKPIGDAIVVVDLGRPVQEHEDKTLQMVQGADGYSVETALASGLWRARIKVIGAKGEQWQRTARFTISADGKLLGEGGQ